MAFDLWTDGVTLIDRVARLFNRHQITRDPLSGLVDGSNVVFYAHYPPILSSGSVAVYTSGSALASGDYALDYDTGAFVLSTAPSVQPAASYTTAKYPDSAIRSILVAGFDEMEGWWTRGWYLSEQVSEVVPITEASSYAYVVNSSGSDPSVAAGYFSTQRAQLNFYTKCTQLSFYRVLMGEHSLSDFLYKEMGGATVDKSMTVKNLERAYNALLKEMPKILEQAGVQELGDGFYGGAIAPLHTREFTAHRFWEKASAQEDWSGTTSYRGGIW
jgi:hypothetical protein